jgi:hypothetical protein
MILYILALPFLTAKRPDFGVVGVLRTPTTPKSSSVALKVEDPGFSNGSS